MDGFVITILIIIGLIIISSIRQINEYEKGILFEYGKFKKVLNAGWHVVLPIIQSYQKIDVRTKAVDVPEQDAITRDNVTVRINAVIYYKVFDAGKAVCAVERYQYAVSQLAQTTMRNAVGAVTLDELLSERDKISTEICEIIDKATDPWGIKVENVELKDVKLPADMQRTIAKVAEAEREKQAVITKSLGEKEAADNLALAARTLSEAPGALHLRTLSTLNDLSSDQSNTIIFAIPIEVLNAFGQQNALGAVNKIKEFTNKNNGE